MLFDFCYVIDILINICILFLVFDVFFIISVEIKVSNSKVLKEKFIWKIVLFLEKKFKMKLFFYGMKYKLV